MRKFFIVYLISVVVAFLSYTQNKDENFGKFQLPEIGTPIGWASVNYLGLNGTTGGKGGNTIHINNFNDLKKELASKEPKIIIVYGKINKPENEKDLTLIVESNKTVYGAYDGAYLINFGLYVKGSNVIIKNLDICNGGLGDEEGYDGIQLGSGAHHIWIDHCTIHECKDGAIDPSKQNKFVTISYCHFYKQDKTILICGNDNDALAIQNMKQKDIRDRYYTVTIHHCYFEATYERHPRVRFGNVHVFNNYYDGCTEYGIGVGNNANIYSEANYFLNTRVAFAKYFDNKNPGYITDIGSLFEGKTYGTKPFPPEKLALKWQPSKFYSYTTHTPEWIKENLKKYVGVGKPNP